MGTARSIMYALAEVLLAPIVAAALEPGPDLALQQAMVLVNTQLLFLSNMGDGSAHASNNLPVLLAGRGYKHSGHVAFDRQKNYPHSNLYVRVLRQMGVHCEKFGCSTSVLSELG